MNKILVVGPSWVGDMVMSQTLYKYIQQVHPGTLVDVLAPAWSEPILARMPEVNRAIPMPLAHGEMGLAKRWRLGRELAESRYDQAILLPNSFKSALLPFFAGIPKRTGWRGEMRYGLVNDMRHLDEAALPRMVQRFAALCLAPGERLADSLPAPELAVDSAMAAHCQQFFKLDPDMPILALCPGAEFGAAKRWPAEYYAALGKRYLAKGWQVALFGSASDQAVTGEIRRACDDHSRCIDLAGHTSLAQAVDLLSVATAVVSNDSGLMHIAAALARPMVVIYGPTSPGFTPPLSDRADSIVAEIDCAPCFERECPLQHHRCMRDTSPEQVATKLEGLLSEGEES